MVNTTDRPLTESELADLLGLSAYELDRLDTEEIRRRIDEANQQSKADPELMRLIGAIALLAGITFLPRNFDGYGFDRATGRYYQGRSPLSHADIRELIRAETGALRGRLERIAERYSQDGNLARFSRDFWQELNLSLLLALQLGAGTRSLITREHLAAYLQAIEREWGYFQRFQDAIALGNLSEAQLIYRSGLYAGAVNRLYFEAERITQAAIGSYGIRYLDPASNHCPECPAYDTNGEYVPASQVIPVGARCTCGGRCRCTVLYASLSELVARGARIDPGYVAQLQ